MKLIVLGATGGIGLEIIRQAIDRGHSVTAFVRSPDAVKPYADRIAIRQGELLNSSDLQSAIAGHDAVLSAFGPRVPLVKTDAHLLGDFAAALACAMHGACVTRAVLVSTAFLFRDAILPPAYLFGRLFFPTVVADAEAMERIIRATSLDWTIVRPPQLTDKPFTGNYYIREHRLPRFGFNISRADVADCLISLAETRTAIRTIVGVSH
jgi:putative NADH-flavin reductase